MANIRLYKGRLVPRRLLALPFDIVERKQE